MRATPAGAAGATTLGTRPQRRLHSAATRAAVALVELRPELAERLSLADIEVRLETFASTLVVEFRQSNIGDELPGRRGG